MAQTSRNDDLPPGALHPRRLPAGDGGHAARGRAPAPPCEHFDLPADDRPVERYGVAKQQHVLKLIETGEFMAFPDALRFILAVKNAGIPVAAASSSKNAKLFLQRIRLDLFAAEQRLDYDFMRSGDDAGSSCSTPTSPVATSLAASPTRRSS